MHQSTYYVAQMAAFSVITAAYNNIAISLAFQRDSGVLKRTNGTPLPAAIYFAARVLHALLISLLLVLITVLFGKLAYSADIPSGGPLLRFVVMLAVGAAAFSALGFAITVVIPNADAAAPIVNATVLPLLFLSGVFIPIGRQRAELDHLDRQGVSGQALRRRHPGRLPGHAVPLERRAGGRDLGPGGLLVAVRRFSWEPRN